MWDEQKRSRFHQLRQRQRDGGLPTVEQAELALLVKELEAAEAGYLTPATERLRQERETLEAQNRALEVLGRRKEVLALRLRDFLAEAQAERQAIESEFAAVLAGNRGSETGD
jgi:hypothetical protein